MRDIGSKYHVTGDIIRKADDTPLPADEPLILLRARDRFAPETLDFYLSLRIKSGQPGADLTDLQSEIAKVKQWQKDHPDKLKTPTDNNSG